MAWKNIIGVIKQINVSPYPLNHITFACRVSYTIT